MKHIKQCSKSIYRSSKGKGIDHGKKVGGGGAKKGEQGLRFPSFIKKATLQTVGVIDGFLERDLVQVQTVGSGLHGHRPCPTTMLSFVGVGASSSATSHPL